MSQLNPPISQPLSALLVNGTKRFAACWRITRKDNAVFRFTDHDQAIVIGGETFAPGDGGFSSTAQEREPTLSPANFESRGAVTDSSITEQDLADGLFRDATVDEFVVDWRYPDQGFYSAHQFVIERTTHSGEIWQASMAGLTRKLTERMGFYFTKNCRWERFGNSDCGFDRPSTAVSATVVSVLVDRLRVTTDLTQEDNFFELGEVTWTSGANNGFIAEVRTNLQDDGTVILQVETKRAIAPGDTFSITRGCPRTPEACKARNNSINYGGFKYLPGDLALTKVPNPS